MNPHTVKSKHVIRAQVRHKSVRRVTVPIDEFLESLCSTRDVKTIEVGAMQYR
jgi:hypothetical protein